MGSREGFLEGPNMEPPCFCHLLSLFISIPLCLLSPLVRCTFGLEAKHTRSWWAPLQLSVVIKLSF